jgi:Ca2+-binding EF-hand superfamily protein
MRLLFERLDRNNDQRLQRQEVQGQPYLERHFERLDSRQRGYLGPDDLTPAQATRGERAKRFFEQADRNGDGGIDRREAEAFSWLQRHFGQADRNGDGRVDRQELQSLGDQRRRQLSAPAKP